MRRFCPLVLSMVLAILTVAAVLPAGADEDAIRVPTRFVTGLQHANEAAGDLLAEAQITGSAALLPSAPPGFGAVPPAPSLRYGSFVVGSRTFFVALGPKDDGSAVLAVDLDGDRNLRGGAEVATVSGRASRSGGRPILKWKFPAQVLGTMKLEVAFQQLARTWNAVLLAAAPQRLELTDGPPAGSRAVVAPGAIRYASIPTAEGAVAVAFVRGDGERLTILADANRNGVIGDGGETIAAPIQDRDVGSIFWKTGDVTLGGSTVAFAYQEIEPQALVTWSAKSTGARRGHVQVGGQDYVFHVLDGDFDGRFNSGGDWWWFGPVTWLERFTRLLPVSMVEADKPFYLDVPWRLMSIDGNGHALVMKDRSAPPASEYLHERTERVNRMRWFPLFGQNRSFEEKRGIDTSRMRATETPQWLHDVGLDEALRRAKAEHKPLLVDFEADWCSICKRWDYHVYSDAEVAGLLSRFVLLKVNVDFGFANDIVRLGGKNPPYLVFLDENGYPLLSFPERDKKGQPTGKQISGTTSFQKPADFARTLKAAYRAWIDRQGR